MANEQTPEPSKHLNMDELDDAQFEQAMLTGELPERNAPAAEVEKESKADTPAEAAAAEPVDQVASTDAKGKKAAPAAVEPEKKKPGHKKTAAERAAEVDAEASDAEQKLAAALERRSRAREALRDAEREDATSKRAEPDGKQPPAVDPKEPAWKKYQAMPDAPKSKDFESLDDWGIALAAFIAEKKADEIVERRLGEREQQWGSQAEFDRQLQSEVNESLTRAKAELAEDPELPTRIDPRWTAVPMKHPSDESARPIEFIKANVGLYAKKPLAVAAYFSTPDGEKELGALCKMSKDRIVRELAYIDARFVSDPDPQDEAAAERPSRVSKAPAPAPVLGKKPAPGRDPRKAPDSFDDFDEWNLTETKAQMAQSR